MSLAYKRLMIAGILIVAALVFFELWAYDVIKIDFISFMEIQPMDPWKTPCPFRLVPFRSRVRHT
jgi:hypothetical protein